MKTVKSNNGVSLKWDDSLKPGDLITAYHKGYHKLERIEDRGTDTTPLFVYTTMYMENGFPAKSRRELACDASYCRSAKAMISNAITRRSAEIKDLKLLLAQL